MEMKIESIEMKINVVTNQVATNSELLNELSNSQKRQQKNFETLALRSIEQETELRELKRDK